ncbi:serine hydrolase [Paucilactobacillus suebicus]|uniref:serine-type D-Ala-D-Ala carboxypeptidase n=1 Tax=Paucilactobacillus suebicus DSM 5007 = KCTC 3549 TaxID=1423807 RepID=A0A0R1W2Z7_9LACO|nr:serine hydrolase [Paucilactobacillus suebicus]KRM10491.1 D-alanyl-D-alanine [Paucilactobacillus suebicus DSM 5007 = KCTC 3549]
MKKLKNFVIGFLLVILTFNVGIVGLSGSAKAATTINASAAMVVDAKTGQVIYQQNGSKRLPIASITKLLTVAVIENEIKQGKLSWNTKVKISKPVAKLSTNSDYSGVPLDKGHSYTVKQLVHATLIKSADAAAIALSTTNGDTTASFNKKMQTMAHKMDIKDAKIYNAAGLTNGEIGSLKLKNVSKNAENEMSANDIAKMSDYIIKKYPSVLNITKITKETFKTDSTTSTVMETLNEMLPGQSTAPTKVVMDGLKTGTSDAAGKSFVGTGTYQGNRFITVVLHANGTNGSDTRFSETVQLLSMIYTDYTQVTVAKGSTVNGVSSLSIPNGKARTVQIRAAKDTKIWLPNGTNVTDLNHAVIIKKALRAKNDTLNAPVKQGQVVANVALKRSDITTINGGYIEVPMAAQSNVQKANLFVRMARSVAGFFGSN